MAGRGTSSILSQGTKIPQVTAQPIIKFFMKEGMRATGMERVILSNEKQLI